MSKVGIFRVEIIFLSCTKERENMGKKKKIIIGVVSALVLCLSFGGGYLLSGNGRIEELLEETGLSKKSTKDRYG